ncbi:MAG: SMC-Scp complex subunit ScpB [Alphaproteobacteria bacterium]|nr:MAG: SMC-Scp complex subunit ScpB [Alphaproteobacteria bacterium]
MPEEDAATAGADTPAGGSEAETDWAIERMIEALLFAASEPLTEDEIAERLPREADVRAALDRLAEFYGHRGVQLVRVAGRWQMRTAPDLAFLLRREVEEPRRLSRAAIETLAIIAYHQPVTRAEIEEIRGVSVSKGTLDILFEAGWIRPAGRREVPGRPLQFATTREFLVHFGLDRIDDLPGLGELKAAGLLESIDEALARLEQEETEAGKTESDTPGAGTPPASLPIAPGETGHGTPEEEERDEDRPSGVADIDMPFEKK